MGRIVGHGEPSADGPVAVEAVDSHGTVVYRRSFDQAP
jgi:hypothetical protein